MSAKANVIDNSPATVPDVALIGRQPVCAADGSLHAYELLFRTADHTSEFTDGTDATSVLLRDAFLASLERTDEVVSALMVMRD